MTAHLLGTGLISAQGGSSGYYGISYGGSGGGGIISVQSDIPFGGALQYGYGIVTNNGNYQGTVGAYSMQIPSSDAICDTGTLATTCGLNSNKVLPNGYQITGANLQINSGGELSTSEPFEKIKISLSGTMSVSGSTNTDISSLTANSVIITSGGVLNGNIGSPDTASDPGASVVNFTIQNGGTVSADVRGYLGGDNYGANGSQGNGSGAGVLANNSAGGSGHGGVGGVGNDPGALGGSTYDSPTHPTDYGSGGSFGIGYVPLSNGGGLVLMDVSGTLTIDGTITANGGTGFNGDGGASSSGGGSGGSINITTATVTGSGTLSADGGSAGNYNASCGGSGGGGIIALTHSAGSPWAGTTTVNAGDVLAAGSGSGMNGIIYLP